MIERLRLRMHNTNPTARLVFCSICFAVSVGDSQRAIWVCGEEARHYIYYVTGFSNDIGSFD